MGAPVGQGGPPPGTPGGPGGPPAGRPGGGGGQPQRDETNAAIDLAIDALFGVLYAFDDTGAKDSSKNLRVLWTRALLAGRGVIQDDVAYDCLPSATRWLVSPENSKVGPGQEQGALSDRGVFRTYERDPTR